jgi:hypothetical protein
MLFRTGFWTRDCFVTPLHKAWLFLAMTVFSIVPGPSLRGTKQSLHMQIGDAVQNRGSNTGFLRHPIAQGLAVPRNDGFFIAPKRHCEERSNPCTCKSGMLFRTGVWTRDCFVTPLRKARLFLAMTVF